MDDVVKNEGPTWELRRKRGPWKNTTPLRRGKKSRTEGDDSKTEDSDVEVVEFKWHEWVDLDNCVECGERGFLIMCESCPSVYHLDCLYPPLVDVPEGQWFCPYCAPPDDFTGEILDEKILKEEELDEEWGVTSTKKEKRGSGPVKDLSDSDDDRPKNKRARKILIKPRKRKTSVSSSSKGSTQKKPRKPRASKPKKPRKVVKGKRKRVVLVEVEASTKRGMNKVVNEAVEFHDKLDVSCCSCCSSREAFRAVVNDDEKLMETVISSVKTVANPLISWSADVQEDVIHKACRNNNVPMVELLLSKAISAQTGGRATIPRHNIRRATGATSIYTHGHAVREINQSRGGKEGNNAFVADDNLISYKAKNTYIEFLYNIPTLSKELFEAFIIDANTPDVGQNSLFSLLENSVYRLAEAGNITLVRHYVELMTAKSKSGYGWNDLHLVVLSDKNEDLPEYRVPSATKKATQNHQITPVHFAALNPNIRYLKELCEKAHCQMATDLRGRTPVFFAAVASTTDALAYLIKEKKCPYKTQTADGISPLYLAMKYGAAHNVKFLLSKPELDPVPAPAPSVPAPEPGQSTSSSSSASSSSSTSSSSTPLLGGPSTTLAPTAVSLQSSPFGGLFSAPNTTQIQQIAPPAAPFTFGRGKGRGRGRRAKKPAAPQNTLPGGINEKVKKTGKTIINIATEFGHEKVIETLLDCDADPLLWDKEKQTPMSIACQKGYLGIVKALLAKTEDKIKPAKLLLFKDRCGRIPIAHAVKNGHFEIVKYLLLQGCPATATDSSSNTLVHYAAAYGWNSVLKLLVSAGASLQAFNDWKTTPMFIAMLKSHMKLANTCLSAKDVDVNVWDSSGKTVLHHLLENKAANPGVALRQILFLVHEKSANVNLSDPINKNTPLHTLCSGPATTIDKELAEILIEHGAYPEALNNNDETPITISVTHKHMDLLEIFLKAKYDRPKEFDVPEKEAKGGTASNEQKEEHPGKDQENEDFEKKEKMEVVDEHKHDKPPQTVPMDTSDDATPGFVLFDELLKLDPLAQREDYYDGDDDGWDLDALKDDLKITRKRKEKASKVEASPDTKQEEKGAGDDGKDSRPRVLPSRVFSKNKHTGDTPLMVIIQMAPPPFPPGWQFQQQQIVDIKKREETERCAKLGIPVENLDDIKAPSETEEQKEFKKMRLKMVKLILDCDSSTAHLNSQNVQQSTALMAALKSNQAFDLSTILLDTDNCDVNLADHLGFTPIMHALSVQGDTVLPLIRRLGSLKADVSACNSDGVSPLLMALSQARKIEILEALVEFKADVNYCTKDGRTPLHEAMNLKDNKVLDLLLKCEADVNFVPNNQESPLFKAMNMSANMKIAESLEMMKMFVGYGADVNQPDCNGKTCLQFAISHYHSLEFARLLINNGADVNSLVPRPVTIQVNWKHEDQESCDSIDVLSDSHSDGSDGKYFHFEMSKLDEILGHEDWDGQKFKIRQFRDDAAVKNGIVVFWRKADGGSGGDAHGRWGTGTAGDKQWQKGDEIRFLVGKPAPITDALDLEDLEDDDFFTYRRQKQQSLLALALNVVRRFPNVRKVEPDTFCPRTPLHFIKLLIDGKANIDTTDKQNKNLLMRALEIKDLDLFEWLLDNGIKVDGHCLNDSAPVATKKHEPFDHPKHQNVLHMLIKFQMDGFNARRLLKSFVEKTDQDTLKKLSLEVGHSGATPLLMVLERMQNANSSRLYIEDEYDDEKAEYGVRKTTQQNPPSEQQQRRERSNTQQTRQAAQNRPQPARARNRFGQVASTQFGQGSITNQFGQATSTNQFGFGAQTQNTFGNAGLSTASAGFSAPNAGFGVPNAGFGVPNAGFGVPNAGFGAQNVGFGAQNAGFGASNANFATASASGAATASGIGAFGSSFGATGASGFGAAINPNQMQTSLQSSSSTPNLSTIAPPPPPAPVYVTVQRKSTSYSLLEFLRDYLEGTRTDLSQVVEKQYDIPSLVLKEEFKTEEQKIAEERQEKRSKEREEVEMKKPECPFGRLCFRTSQLHKNQTRHKKNPPGWRVNLGSNALHFVAHLNGGLQMELAKLLIEFGAKTDVASFSGQTPLMLWCGVSNKTEMAELFLEQKETDVHASDEYGFTALSNAVNFSARNSSDAQHGFELAFQMESLLLASNADINHVDDYGRTPLHYVFVQKAQKYVAGTKDPIELVSDVCSYEEADKKPVSVDVADVYGRTPLAYAAMLGSHISAKYLMDRGARIDSTDSKGNQPFQHSIVGRHMGLAVDIVQSVDVTRKLFDRNKYQTVSSFRYVLDLEWMGLAYLMIDKGIDITAAVSDALAANKFQLVLTLLAKTPNRLMQKADKDGVNLFHSICSFGPDHNAKPHYEDPWSMRIARILMKNDVSMHETTKTHFRLPLHYSVEQGHVNLTKLFLENGTDVNFRDKLAKELPIHIACRSRNSQILSALIQHEADINALVEDNYFVNCIHISVSCSDHITTEILLNTLKKNGGSLDVNAVYNKKAYDRTALHTCVTRANVVIARLLIQADADVCQEMDPTVKENLHDIVPLQAAVRSRTLLMVKLLVEAKADTSTELFSPNDDGGIIALHTAVQQTSDSIVELLLQPQIGDRVKLFGAEYAELDGRAGIFTQKNDKVYDAKSPETVFVKLDNETHTRVVKLANLRKEDNQDVSKEMTRLNPHGDVTALHTGVRFQLHKIVQLLLNHGSDPNKHLLPPPPKVLTEEEKIKERINKAYRKTHNQPEPVLPKYGDVTCLHMAIRKKDRGIIAALLEAGADPDIPLDGKQDDFGGTCLHMAIRDKDYELIQLLVNFHANPNVRNNAGMSPLSIAVKQNNEKLAAILLRGPISYNAEDRKKIARAIVRRKAQVILADPTFPDTEQGRTPLHHAIHPFGIDEPSYENVEMLELLVRKTTKKSKNMFEEIRTIKRNALPEVQKLLYVEESFIPGNLLKKKFNVDCEDAAGKTPLFYSCFRHSHIMLDKLLELGATDSKEARREAAESLEHANEIEEKQFDEEHDDIYDGLQTNFDQVVDAREMRKQFAVDDEEEVDPKELAKVPVDPLSGEAATGKVLLDKDGYPYDIMMNYTDVGHGSYGLHNFYKMQLIHNKVTDLTLLWTRWGRVGEQGKYQITPYATQEDVINEFESIFKQKSANLWENRFKSKFEKAKGKYVIVRQKKQKKGGRDKLMCSLDEILEIITTRRVLDNGMTLSTIDPKSVLSNVVQGLIHAMVNLNAIRQEVSGTGFRNMPLGELTDDQLDQGYAKLLGIGKVIDKRTASSTECSTKATEKSRIEREQRDRKTSRSREKQKRERDRRHLKLEKARETKRRKLAEKQSEAKADDEAVNKGKLEADGDENEKDTDDEKETAEDLEEEKQIEEREAKEEAEFRVVEDPKIQKFAEEIILLQKDIQDADSKLRTLTNEFYELIPTSQYTHQALSSISNTAQLGSNIASVTYLRELQVPMRILLGAQYQCKVVNPLDYCYAALDCKLLPLNYETREYDRIIEYCNEGCNPGSYGYHNIDVFKVQRKGEAERFKKHQSSRNRLLLWHGSGVSNFVGILTQGLRIAPPEAPMSGYAFGKGVYFADMFQKSLAYSYSRVTGTNVNRSMNDVRCLLLCEVALGKMRKVVQPGDNVLGIPNERYQSTKALGLRGPDFKNMITLKDGLSIPNGQVISYPPTLEDEDISDDEDEEKADSQQSTISRTESATVAAAGYGFGTGFNANAPTPAQPPIMQSPLFQQGANPLVTPRRQLRRYIGMNEYIVYSVDQVKIKYLVLVDRSRSKAENKRIQEIQTRKQNEPNVRL